MDDAGLMGIRKLVMLIAGEGIDSIGFLDQPLFRPVAGRFKGDFKSRKRLGRHDSMPSRPFRTSCGREKPPNSAWPVRLVMTLHREFFRCGRTVSASFITGGGQRPSALALVDCSQGAP